MDSQRFKKFTLRLENQGPEPKIIWFGLVWIREGFLS